MFSFLVFSGQLEKSFLSHDLGPASHGCPVHPAGNVQASCSTLQQGGRPLTQGAKSEPSGERVIIIGLPHPVPTRKQLYFCRHSITWTLSVIRVGRYENIQQRLWHTVCNVASALLISLFVLDHCGQCYKSLIYGNTGLLYDFAPM